VTHLATGEECVWKRIYYVLEDTCTLLLINMHAMKRVLGCNTDAKDLGGWRSCSSVRCCSGVLSPTEP
jgi:hypothetical protein